MLGMADLAQLLPRRTDQCSERRQLLMEKELDNTVTLIMMEKPSLSDTLLARMGLESLREIMFLKELTD